MARTLLLQCEGRINLTAATFESSFWQAKYTAIRVPGVISVPRAVKTSPVQGIVQARGAKFIANGVPFYFVGTNAYYLHMPDLTEYEEIDEFFQVSADQGVTVVRTWGFSNGYGKDAIPMTDPIQPTLGVWNEKALMQLDKVIATAGTNGIRLIIPFVNYWIAFGGMQWYVDEVLGPGKPLETFYTDTKVKQAYKNYVAMILSRVNVYTKIPYKQDPAVFAWELANEPHTNDGFDKSGAIVKAWVSEMAAYIKSLDPAHMVATGEEGYGAGRTNGNADWIDDGTKGTDFKGNTADPNIDFATIHLYPTFWGFTADDFWLGPHFVVDRAQIAHSLGKPIILEEIGLEYPSTSNRDSFFRVWFSWANSADYAAFLVWQVYSWPIDNRNTFNFDWQNQGAFALRRQIVEMDARTRGSYVPSPVIPGNQAEPPYPPSPPSPPPDACQDVPPPGAGTYPCSDQASWGKCKEKWMVGYCRRSCKTCYLPPGPEGPPGPVGTVAFSPPPPGGTSTGPCEDKPAPGNYTCQQQAAWGKCC